MSLTTAGTDLRRASHRPPLPECTLSESAQSGGCNLAPCNQDWITDPGRDHCHGACSCVDPLTGLTTTCQRYQSKNSKRWPGPKTRVTRAS